MRHNLLYPVTFALFLFPAIVKAQAKLSEAETQNFYRLIRETSEFKDIKHKVDSVNKVEKAMPEEFDINIVTKKTEATDDEHIFEAVLVRKWVIGLAIEYHYYKYDPRKKQIISAMHDQRVKD